MHLAGRVIELSAPDGDHYLKTMSSEGPIDLAPIFAAFCTTGSTVIDVGANIGVTAVLAGILCAPGRVLALEPVPEAFAHLVENVRRSALGNVTCLNVAASATAGTVHLVSRAGFHFAAFVGGGDTLERYAGYTSYPAAAETIDDLAASEGLADVNFVKIDVEGYELEVLRGARRTLRAYEPTVFLEANHYCLNIFRRISLVDFTDEVLSIFPVVYAVDTSFEVLDLSERSSHPHFFHENVVSRRFPNLLCGFTPLIGERLAAIATASPGR